jgi:hypothetical protein
VGESVTVAVKDVVGPVVVFCTCSGFAGGESQESSPVEDEEADEADVGAVDGLGDPIWGRGGESAAT